MSANPMRGEASVRVGGSELVVRPSFQALVAAVGGHELSHRGAVGLAGPFWAMLGWEWLKIGLFGG